MHDESHSTAVEVVSGEMGQAIAVEVDDRERGAGVLSTAAGRTGWRWRR